MLPVRDDGTFDLQWVDATEKREENPYSDWAIVVQATDGSLKKSFLVHKHILAAMSDYFKIMFEGSFAETASNVSTFCFPKCITENFDWLLKYCYSLNFLGPTSACELEHQHSKPSTISTLLYLSDYFQMEYLNQRCKRYLKRLSKWEMSNRLSKIEQAVSNPDIASYYHFFVATRCSFLRDFIVAWFCVIFTKDDRRRKEHDIKRYEFRP